MQIYSNLIIVLAPSISVFKFHVILVNICATINLSIRVLHKNRTQCLHIDCISISDGFNVYRYLSFSNKLNEYFKILLILLLL